MARLITDFFTVAQSGPTADKREIKKDWLTDAGSTYDPKIYAAKIWPEHMRWKPFGVLVETRSIVDEETGIVTTENRVSPNPILLSFIRNNELTQPSIEIVENFAQTGKAYQVGLGCTDRPASLGVEDIPISFNSNPHSLFNERIALDVGCNPSQVHVFACPTPWADLEFKKERKFFDIGAALGLNHSQNPPAPNEPAEEKEMTKEELQQVFSEMKTSLVSELREEFNQKPPENNNEETPPASNAASTESTVTLSLEQFNAFNERIQGLEDQVKAFGDQSTGVEIPESAGGDGFDPWDLGDK